MRTCCLLAALPLTQALAALKTQILNLENDVDYQMVTGPTLAALGWSAYSVAALRPWKEETQKCRRESHTCTPPALSNAAAAAASPSAPF